MIHIIRHQPSGNDIFHTFDGMDENAARAQMATLTSDPFDVVDEEAWQSGVAAAKAAFNEKRIAAGLPPI